jgi:hypothetical protein
MAAYEIRRTASGEQGEQTIVLKRGKARRSRLGSLLGKLSTHPGAFDRYPIPPHGVTYSYELWVCTLGRWAQWGGVRTQHAPVPLAYHAV